MENGHQADVVFRDATRDDLAAIVRLLADDALGATRERYGERLPEEYETAFAAIDEDPNEALLVGESDGAIVATAQLSFLPSLSRSGSFRAQVEAVRVATDRRGSGLGARLMQVCIERARDRGCRLVQLTSDKRRKRAIGFYERLGFVASHQGMKLHLD